MTIFPAFQLNRAQCPGTGLHRPLWHNSPQNTCVSLPFPLACYQTYSVQAVKSKIVHATDTWTLPGMMFAFAGTIATWINDDWNLIKRVIGFSQVDRHEHTGSGSVRVLFEAMQNIGSASKISGFHP